MCCSYILFAPNTKRLDDRLAGQRAQFPDIFFAFIAVQLCHIDDSALQQSLNSFQTLIHKNAHRFYVGA